MAHVEDRWMKPGPDGKKVPTPRNGKGKRWAAMWTEHGQRRNLAFDSKAAAVAKLAAVAVAQQSGTHVTVAAGKVTLEDYSKRWLVAQIHTQDSTQGSVGRMWRIHILPALGRHLLAELTPDRIQAVIPTWSKTLNAASAALCFGYLSAALTAAVKNKMIPANPCEDVNLPPIAKHKVVPILPQRVHEIADRVDSRFRALVLLAAGTGMRQGEMIALTADRVKISARSVTIKVDRQLLSSAPTFGPLKTKRSYRDIVEGAELADALRRHIAMFPPHPSGLLFTRASGLPLKRQDMGWILPGGWHQMRHFHASLLIAAGLSPTAVAERLGDTVAVVMSTYAHLWPTDSTRMQNAVSAHFWEARPIGVPALRVVPELVENAGGLL